MKQLIDIGDPDAPSGSEPWCRSFLQSLCRLKREGEFAVSNLKYSLREFRDHRYFEQLPDKGGDPFNSWEAFVQTREPFGLGMPFDVAEAIINEPDDRRLLKDVLRFPGRPRKGEEKGAVRTLKRGSESRAYIIARLKRDGFAELAAKVEAKKISARAAAGEAGMPLTRRHCPYCGHEL